MQHSGWHGPFCASLLGLLAKYCQIADAIISCCFEAFLTAASFASVAASSMVVQPSQNSSSVRCSFRPRRPEYLTRFERYHFHVHNVTPEQPRSPFFNLQDLTIRTRERSWMLFFAKESLPTASAVFSGHLMEGSILLCRQLHIVASSLVWRLLTSNKNSDPSFAK